MACGCLDATVLDFIEMAKKQNKDLTHPVVSKLVEALAALDDAFAEEEPTDLERLKTYRAIRAKIETVTSYVTIRI